MRYEDKVFRTTPHLSGELQDGRPKYKFLQLGFKYFGVKSGREESILGQKLPTFWDERENG